MLSRSSMGRRWHRRENTNDNQRLVTLDLHSDGISPRCNTALDTWLNGRVDG